MAKTDPKIDEVVKIRKPRFKALFQYVMLSFALIAAVEYFKFSTRIHYDWFHCTPHYESVDNTTSVNKIFAVGGPSCDKRGELKTIVKRITRDYEPNDESVSFCIIENKDIDPIHYPLGEIKGEPGYWAYVGYDTDRDLIRKKCENNTIFHM